METSTSGHTRRLSITKLQRETAVAAELIAICQSAAADGRLNAEEVAALRDWLQTNTGAELPAISFLQETVRRILADGHVTSEEVRELYGAIETILPPDIRESVRGTRRAAELQDRELQKSSRIALKEQAKASKEAARDANKQEAARYQRSQPLEIWDFMVAGVLHEGRERVVRTFVDPEDTVYLVRDRDNQFSRCAIEVRLGNGMQIGFVPEKFAREVSVHLDQGLPHAAFIKKVLTGGRAPIPVVIAGVYHPDADRDDLVFEHQVPTPVGAPNSTSSGPPATMAARPTPQVAAPAPSVRREHVAPSKKPWWKFW